MTWNQVKIGNKLPFDTRIREFDDGKIGVHHRNGPTAHKLSAERLNANCRYAGAA